MIGCRNVVMTVSLKALNGILSLKIILLHDLLEQIIMIRHLLQARVEARFPIGRETGLFKPGVLPNSGNSGSLFWVSIEDLCQKISSFIGDKLRDLVVSAEDLFVELGSFRILKGQVAANHGIQHNSGAPDVRLKTVIAFSSNHLSPLSPVLYLPQERRNKVIHKLF